MLVISYEVHNILRISDLKLDMEGRHLFLVGGRNRQGKTSAIDALLMAICGKRGMDYPVPALKEGEDEGWVHVQLTGSEKILEDQHITLQLYMKRKRGGQVSEKFRILDSSGEEAPNPRTMLKDLYSLRGFDPLEFDRMGRREQRETLMEITKLDVGTFQAEHKRIFDERTGVNRDVDKAKLKFAEMPFHKDAPKKVIVVKELMERLEEAQKHNRAISDANDELAAAEELEVKTAAELIELQELLKVKELAAEACTKIVKAKQRIIAKLGELKEASAITQEINAAGETNAKVTANEARQAARKELDEIQKHSEDLTDQLQTLESDQDEKMNEVEWPVEGLAVDDEGVLFKDLPFENASAAERYRVSTRIGMAQNPELKLLVSQHGNDLDLEALAGLEEELKAGGFQMLLEFVTRTDADEALCAVVLEDGKAKVKASA